MSDSNWQDPFADDEASRAREERRLERERRRREEGARESLGEKVSQGLEPDEPSAGSGTSPVEADEPVVDEVPDPTVAAPAERFDPEPEYVEPVAAAPVAPPRNPPPARRPPQGAIRRRRMGLLVVLGAIIVMVAAAGAYISQRGDDAPPAAPVKERKTFEVVIPEGLTRIQMAEVAKKEGVKGDYLKASESSKAIDLKKLGAQDAPNLEGFLFPATYELFKGATAKDLVAKQVEAFQANLAEVDLGASKKAGYTPYEVVNIASMVEREIAVAEERELASSVIYNRLDQGTPLGIDATIRYEDNDFSGQIVQSRLDADTPYNTRINAGLPPTPIGNPGLESLEAAANPADTDFFFFVVKPGSCNEHTFVETDAEFAQAEAEYQAALQAEGGSPTEC